MFVLHLANGIIQPTKNFIYILYPPISLKTKNSLYIFIKNLCSVSAAQKPGSSFKMPRRALLRLILLFLPSQAVYSYDSPFLFHTSPLKDGDNASLSIVPFLRMISDALWPL